MKDDPETDKAFGWVLEMCLFSLIFLLPSLEQSAYVFISSLILYWCWKRYGYAVASALHGVRHILRKDFMVQVVSLSSTLFLFIRIIYLILSGRLLLLLIWFLWCDFLASMGSRGWKFFHHSLHLRMRLWHECKKVTAEEFTILWSLHFTLSWWYFVFGCHARVR